MKLGEAWQIEKLHDCQMPSYGDHGRHQGDCTAPNWGRIVWHANKPTQTLDQCLYYASSHRYIMATQHLYRIRCIDTGEIIPMEILVRESWVGIG